MNNSTPRLVKLYNQLKRGPAFSSAKMKSTDLDGVLNALIAYNKFGAYCTPISSQRRPAVQTILKGNVHEPDTIAFIRKNCKNGDVVHAGTYFGDFLPALSSGLSPEARLWAFEPNDENYRCAEITLLLNQLKNIVLTNAGLGASSGEKKLIVQNEKGLPLGGGSHIVNSKEDSNAMNVQVVSIDEVVPEDRDVTIIQLDVEGYEKQALEGALKTISRCKPHLILEDQKQVAKSKWFKEHISSLGYVATGMVHLNSVYSLR